jgi:ribose transport system substrate-binding protein
MKRALLSLSVFLAAAMLAFPGGQKEKAAQGKQIFLGLDTRTVTSDWESFFQQSFQWFCRDNGWKEIAYDAQGDPAAQITQCRLMIDQGIDGLIVAAQDPEAARPIVDFAKGAAVPIFTAYGDIDSPDVKMYVGFSDEKAGSELAQRMADYLKNKYDGRVQGTVLEMLGPIGSASAIERSKGFHDVLDRYSDVKVIQAIGDFQEAAARAASLNVLRASPDIDACYCANGPMAVGAVEAMKDLGIDSRAVYTAAIDATPEVLSLVKSGDIREALDQDPAFTIAIAAYYCVQYLKMGEAGLPKAGDIVNARDLSMNTAVRHAGALIWADNSTWAPAEVVTGPSGHLWFQTAAVRVTRDNAGAPSLWANIKLPGGKS